MHFRGFPVGRPHTPPGGRPAGQPDPNPLPATPLIQPSSVTFAGAFVHLEYKLTASGTSLRNEVVALPQAKVERAWLGVSPDEIPAVECPVNGTWVVCPLYTMGTYFRNTYLDVNICPGWRKAIHVTLRALLCCWIGILSTAHCYYISEPPI